MVFKTNKQLQVLVRLVMDDPHIIARNKDIRDSRTKFIKELTRKMQPKVDIANKMLKSISDKRKKILEDNGLSAHRLNDHFDVTDLKEYREAINDLNDRCREINLYHVENQLTLAPDINDAGELVNWVVNKLLEREHTT